MSELRDVQDELRKALSTRRRLLAHWNAKIAELRDRLGEVGCDHPETTEYTWEHDSGYGHQSTVTGLRCDLCGMRRPWKTMGTWVAKTW